MKPYEWVDAYCLAKKGVTKDYKLEWDAIRYSVGDKMFMMRCSNNEKKPIMTMKLEPAFGDFLRQEFTDIIPGYYMNKTHWNSLHIEGNVPDDVVRDMIDKAYLVVLNSLTKKRQKEIMEQEVIS